MINANELRIGNWVEVENYKSIQLENIHPKGTTNGDEQYLISMLKPIPLTEEILLKCGFWEITKRESFYKNGSIWGIGVDDTIICLDPDWREQPSFHCGIEYTDSPVQNDENVQYNFAHKIKYLHQLQNLYFALTGEELKIEL